MNEANPDDLHYPVVGLEGRRITTFERGESGWAFRGSMLARSIESFQVGDQIYVDSSAHVYDVVNITRISRGEFNDIVDNLLGRGVPVRREVHKRPQQIPLDEFVVRIRDTFQNPEVQKSYSELGVEMSRVESVLESATSIAEIIGFLMKAEREE